MEEVQAEEEMMPLGQNTLRQLKMGLLHDAISDMTRWLYGRQRTNVEVNESKRRKLSILPVIVLYCCDVLERNDMRGWSIEQ